MHPKDEEGEMMFSSWFRLISRVRGCLNEQSVCYFLGRVDSVCADVQSIFVSVSVETIYLILN